MKVAEVMAVPATIRDTAKVTEAMEIMQQQQLRALVVEKTQDEDAYGIVTEGDILGKVLALKGDPQQMQVFEIMTKPCIALEPDVPVEQAICLMAQHHLHSAPVIQDRLLGILSINRLLGTSSEEDSFVDFSYSLELEAKIKRLSAAARDVCQVEGPTSQPCTDAWSIVGGLEAELARVHESSSKTAVSRLR